ncbi:MAG: hypothetical protein QOG15_2971 [Solirubrobacteraceae bacterium]|nr:hypothetical protein [Solirubrobacteraceae bacterium]
MRRAVAATPCLLACALLGACGAREPAKKSAPTTPAGAAKPAEVTPVTIAAPIDGKRVRAKETKSGAWITGVDVSGTAAPDSTVYFRAGCRPKPCVAQATAGADGTWTSRLKVRTKPSAPFVTIDAASRKVVTSGTTVVTIELFGPRTVLARSGPSKPKENRATQKPRSLPHEVLVIGDSLAVGIEAPLRQELKGWKVEVDALKSRPLRTGMQILARQGSPPAILAFSLFTNDDPRNVSALVDAVRATATRSGGCAVWATIVRPPYLGVSYDAVNRKLKQLARQDTFALGLQVVDWAGAVQSEPSLLAGDGVHATPTGYATMARLYAGAIRACAGESL